MLKNDLILKNPLRLLGDSTENLLTNGGCGAVLARSGVGKTSLAVQLALNTLLRNKNVLHISLDDPVSKVALWYEEVFRNISSQYNTGEANRLWESVLTHRFIMTFQAEGFNVPVIEERLTDLTEQKIFFPDMVLIDGLPFSEFPDTTLPDLKSLAKKFGFHIWFTVRTHRDDTIDEDGFPPNVGHVAALFETVFFLQPKGNEVHVRVIKGNPKSSVRPKLMLDPSTMLIKNRT